MSQSSLRKMKHLLGLLFAVLIITGCTKTEDPDREARENPASQVQPEGIDINALREVTIQATDDMRFVPSVFEVYPGQSVKVTLKNIGVLPKQTMGHNWLLLSHQGKPMVVVTSAQVRPDDEYIPENAKEVLLAYTRLLGPGEEDTVEFTAPEIPGAYDFVCTFPGHYAAGMKGKMNVLTLERAGQERRQEVYDEQQKVTQEAAGAPDSNEGEPENEESPEVPPGQRDHHN